MDMLSGVAIKHTVIPRNLELPANLSSQPAHAPAVQSDNGERSSAREDIKVNLSVEGLKASASAQKAGNSSQASQAKEIEKVRERIKELQQEIQEQQAQLQAIQADRRLTPEEKAARTSAISQQLASLNSALTSATSQLMEALKGRPKTSGADGVQPLPYVHHEAAPTSTSSS